MEPVRRRTVVSKDETVSGTGYWIEYECPDYLTDPALLSEMLEWLANDWYVEIVRPHKHGWWTVGLFTDVTEDQHNELDTTLQEAVARCVLWVLANDQ